MPMRVVILGVGTIIPHPGEGATSLLVEAGGGSMLFDCGPGALEMVERSGRSYTDIGRIFLTHYHPDHTLGLGRLFSAMKNDEEYPAGSRLAIYGPAGLERFVGGWDSLYGRIVPGPDRLTLVELPPGTVALGGGIEVTAGEAAHGETPALAYRVECCGSAVAYTGDTAYTGAVVELATDADLLVAECSFPDGHAASGHMTPSVVGRLAKESGAKRVLLVHRYPSVDPDEAVEVARSLAGGAEIEAAAEGMEIEL